jgi:hypothetical protein
MSGVCARIEAWWHDTWWTVAATFRSALNLSIERYPELQRDGKLANLSNDELVLELAGATEHFKLIKPTETDAVPIDDAIKLALASLEESKRQTEYQDNKASRLLTVTSFVSALSAVLLAAFADRYPLDQLSTFTNPSHWLLAAAYVAFMLFILLALCGALVTFHATRTRFKYATDKSIKDETTTAKSMLFYKGIAGTGPVGWADSYVNAQKQAGTPVGPERVTAAAIRNDLKVIYFRNYVIEAYLVAAKTADKLRYLAPAQALLAWALRFLIGFVILFALCVACVPNTKPPPSLNQITILPVVRPVPVRLYTSPSLVTTAQAAAATTLSQEQVSASDR